MRTILLTLGLLCALAGDLFRCLGGCLGREGVFLGVARAVALGFHRE